jgi:hypothetical protein
MRAKSVDRNALTATQWVVYARTMTTKFLALITAIGFAGVCITQAQSPTPGESPAQSPSPTKSRTHKKAGTAAASAEATASASPAASPKAKRGRKKAAAVAAASPAASPTPAKFNLGDLFKPKTSASASPAAATRAPAKNASAQAATRTPAPGGGHGLVWVNTETHVYHREGSRFYGTTKNGKYMTEAEAIKEGNKAAAKGL